MIFAIALVVLVGCIVTSAVSAADTVLKALLHNYATDRSKPIFVDRHALESAFKPRDAEGAAERADRGGGDGSWSMAYRIARSAGGYA